MIWRLQLQLELDLEELKMKMKKGGKLKELLLKVKDIMRNLVMGKS